VLPDEPGEWSQLRKGSSNGVFRIILALSWVPVNINLTNVVERFKVEAIMKDLVWVLKVISNPIYFGNPNKTELTKQLVAGLGKRKGPAVESSTSIYSRIRIFVSTAKRILAFARVLIT
jgi:hypothetical protein